MMYTSNTIRADYALASSKMDSFKEIVFSDFQKIFRLMAECDSVNTERSPITYADIDNAIRSKKIEIKEKSRHDEPLFQQAKQARDEFRRKHREVFYKEEQIRYREPTLWKIITQGKRSLEELVQKHKQKYAHIYAEDQRLAAAVWKYAKYSEDNLYDLISRECSSIETTMENQISHWFADHEKRVNKVNAEFTAKTGPYSFILKDLSIEIKGTTSIVKCTRYPLRSYLPKAWEPFDQTLINKQITFSR